MKGLEGSKLGRYELRFRVAQGGMSEVYLGYDRRVKRYVAVKVLYGSDEPFVRRFEREARAVGTLSHDHILPLFDFGEQRPWYYLVMPFVEGGTLRDYLHKRERLTLEEAGSFLEQIANALQHAHDHGVVHRDVKPSNILLRLDGHAYLVDFGLAKAKLEAEFQTHSGAMVGTPEYMAPEQSDGRNDSRSDIYSLGIILYQMLTGKVPFTADSPVGVTLKHIQTPPTPPSQLNSEIPSAIEEVMLKALAKTPEDRFQEAQAFATAYKLALYHKPSHDLGDGMLTYALTGESETQHVRQTRQQTDNTMAAIEQITTQLSIPSTKPQLFPLERGQSSFISYTAEMSKRKRKRLRPVHIAVLALMIILCIALSLVQISQTRPAHKAVAPRPNMQQTIQAQAQKTATSLIHAQATLAAQARLQAITGITSSIGAGNVLYYNAMSKKSAGWINDGNQCYFTPQGYHVHTGLAHAVAWCYSNQQSFSNAVMSVQAQMHYGGFCGLVFRLNPYHKTFYVLELNSYGQYRLQRALGNDPARWLTLIDWTSSSAIHQGYEQYNTMLVIATKARFSIYINQQLAISTFIDNTYTAGLIGLLVGGDSIYGTEAIFKQLVIFQRQPE
jgi:serine/threonine protein kinase